MSLSDPHTVADSSRRPSLRSLPGRLTAIALAIAACVGFHSSTLAGEWAGTEETRDGATHVMNPATPSNGTVSVDVEEMWRLGGLSDAEEEFFGVISGITTDSDGNVYLLDAQLTEVKVFSANGEYVRTIGREGEGPGEFRTPTALFFMPDGNLGVLQPAPPKVVKLTPMGDPAGELGTPKVEVEGFLALAGAQFGGGNLVTMISGSFFDQEKGTFKQSLMLKAVDNDGEVKASYYEESRLWEFANPVIDEQQWDTIQNRWTVADDGRVFGCPDHDGYEIHVWNADGSVDRVVHAEHQRHKRSADEIERIRGIYEVFTRQAPNSEIVIGDYDKAITSIYTRGSQLWVLSSEGSRDNDANTIGTFDVFDKQGRFIKQVTFNGEGDAREDGFFFVDDRLYVVTQLVDAAVAMQGGGTEDMEEDEDAIPMEVICYRIDDSKLAMK